MKKLIKHQLLLLFLLLISGVAYAQPANDACASATSLPCGTSNLAGTTVASVSETHGTGCTMSGYGVWYTFTGDGFSTTITVSGGTLDVEIAVVSGTCAAKTNISCTDVGGAGGTDSYTFTTVNGTTYYVYVGYYAVGATTGTFNISRTCASPPANDACTSATALPCGTSNLAGTTVATVNETHGTGCTMSGNGVWYTFTGDGNSTTITTSGGSLDVEIAVVSGTCAAKTNISCTDVAGAGGTDSYTFTTVNGTTYFVYVGYYAASATTGTFNISRTCSGPPTNDVCASATNLPCGTSNLAGTTVGTVSETHGTGCTISDYGVWYTFVGDGNATTITTSGGTLDAEIAVVSGSCASKTNVSCTDGAGAGGTETYSFTTVNGTTYLVYIAYYGAGATTGTFNISRSCSTPLTNDACGTATNLPCGTTNLAGTTVGSVFETAPGSCFSSGYGVWYSFTGDGQQTTISLTGQGGYDTDLGIYSGSCGSLTNITCQDVIGTETFTFTTTNGVNYFIYVAYYTSSTTTGTFTISRSCTAAPTPPSNDACAGATSLACGTTNLAGTTVASAFEALPPTCFTTSNYGVWYTFTGDGQGSTISVTATGGFDTGIGIYSGSCGSLTSLYCLDSWGGSETQSFATTNGVQYYIYVSYYDDWYNTTGTFTISRTCAPVSPCGTPVTNDYCASPAILTEAPGTFSANTSSTFTPDIIPPSFCGSVENNSWYQFTANTTTETFPITSVTGCTNGWGIQAHVYAVTYNGSGCCNTFTSTSNCYNPGNTTTGTVTATGLTIGNQYILMIDGNAGDDCDFTVSGWTATGILPVEYIALQGDAEEFGDLITWSTASESNNKQFNIHHSKDGTNFTKIGEVTGALNSNSRRDYSYINENSIEGTNYYFVEQEDLNGHKVASNMIQVTRWNLNQAIIKVYPNPTYENAFFEYYSQEDRKISYRLLNYVGESIEENSAVITKGKSIFPISLQSLPAGIYILEINSQNESNTIKIIKN